MESLILGLHKISDIRELDGLLVDTDIFQKISEITPGGLVGISKDTVLKLSVVLELGVSWEFTVHSVSEDVLVSKEILDL